MEFQNPNPQQPNSTPQPAATPEAAPATPAPMTPPAPAAVTPQMSNMQSSPLFTDTPAKKSNSAIIVLIVVIILVIAAGVIFFLMAQKPAGDNSPVVDGQVVDGVVDATGQGSAFGQQQTSNRELNSGNEVATELNDINAELEALDIDSFEEEFAEIDRILDDINF